MTLTEATTRVRNLLNQTDTANTLWDDDDFITHALNEARRWFATILDESYLIRLRTRAALSVSGGVGTYPTDFLRVVNDPYVTIDTVPASRIPENERWRLKHLANQDSIAANVSNESVYYYEDSAGVNLLPSSATACSYEYVAIPDDLSGSENYELPDSINDLTVHYAFEKCLGTTRGSRELALQLAKDRGFKTRELHNAAV